MSTNPAGPVTVSGLSMSLLQFDKIVVLSQCGYISSGSYNPAFEEWDATAECNVSLDDIKNMFAFQSDHFDVNDLSEEDLRFYVDNSKIPSLDLSSNIVYSGSVIDTNQTGGVLTGSDMAVQKDYIRHLAKLLFNTAYGVDLFINEQDLVDSVKLALESAWASCVEDLTNISIVGSDSNLVGDENHKHLRNDALDANGKSTFNICRELFKMMISRASSRFTDLPQLAVDPLDAAVIDPNAQNLYRLPFIVGDQLVIRIVIKPCEHQESFKDPVVYPDANAEIQANERAYLLYLNLVA